jgi:hypothetical protein
VAASLVLAVVCSNPAAARQQKGQKGPADKSKQKPPVVKPAPATPRVQAFELVRADPEEVRLTVTKIWMTRGGVNALRLAVDGRTRTLFARGLPDHLDSLAAIVAVLDAPADKPLPESKGFRVIRLKNGKVNEVLQILNGLGSPTQAVALPKLNALIVPDGDASAKDIEVIIGKLDGAKKAGPPVKTGNPVKTAKGR